MFVWREAGVPGFAGLVLGSGASSEQSSSGTSTGGTGAGCPHPSWQRSSIATSPSRALAWEMPAAPVAGAMPGADPALLPVPQVR